jgi:hypothetical protein
MKLVTQIRYYDRMIVTKIQINIFNKNKVIEVFSGNVSPGAAEGLVLISMQRIDFFITCSEVTSLVWGQVEDG